ncbi:MAG: carboxypeptidase M32, partial [Pseudomonadota bacterium]|nr:carboxypeptidase M32 [Pseudomonadota bacterium]
GEAIEAASAQNDLDPWQRANVAESRRRYLRATALPADLVAAKARAESQAFAVWQQARPADDFAAALPSLRTCFDLARQAGQAIADATGQPLYEAMIEGFEPDLSVAEIDAVFDDYAAFLPGFLDDVLSAQDRRDPPLPLEGPFDVEQQKAVFQKIMGALGFDFEHGRLDTSAHPFCGGTPTDVRMTTRYRDDTFLDAMMGVVHETGHALYEQGLPPQWARQPVGQSRGMVLHESQSLTIEMQVVRSLAFMKFAAPQLAQAFGQSGPAWTAENLTRHAARVERSFIRVEADEVTYPAHVILRYRLEKAMLKGDLDLADLPQAWGDGLEALLGIRPPSDREGCLQDIHWYSGAFGYFPTYSLGAMCAAQVFAAARDQLGDVDARIEAGDFAPLLGWLRTNIHGKASSGSTNEILSEATGSPLRTDAFKAHLRWRYLDG